jgi:two-component system KDP operon response regulator KdpE
LCRAIRRVSNLGIIVLRGQNNIKQDRIDIKQDRIDALNAGADDHLASPFVVQELLARVRAVLRRVTRPEEERILLHDRAIDLKSYKIRGPGNRVSHLTPKEFLVLQCLLSHADKPFTHQSLAQTVWQRDGLGELEFVRVVIKQLRRKLESDPDHPRYILTERSVGYRFRMASSAAQANTPELQELLSLAG